MSLSYDFYPAVLYAINEICQGETKTRACDNARISTIVFDTYIERHAELKQMFNEADQRGRDALADALIHIDDHKRFGSTDSRMAKVISENIKWLLSKRDTKNYGDKLEVKHEITMDRAIIDRLERARNRTIAISAPVVEDAVYEVLSDDDEIAAMLR